MLLKSVSRKLVLFIGISRKLVLFIGIILFQLLFVGEESSFNILISKETVIYLCCYKVIKFCAYLVVFYYFILPILPLILIIFLAFGGLFGMIFWEIMEFLLKKKNPIFKK